MSIVSKVPIDAFPAIFKILEKAQKDISMVIGIDVKLSINVTGAPTEQHDLMWLALQQNISVHSNVPWVKITQRSKKRPLPMLKALYCYIGVKRVGGKSLMGISQDVGYTDHTDVIAAIKRFQNYLDIGEPTATRLYTKITNLMYEKQLLHEQ